LNGQPVKSEKKAVADRLGEFPEGDALDDRSEGRGFDALKNRLGRFSGSEPEDPGIGPTAKPVRPFEPGPEFNVLGLLRGGVRGDDGQRRDVEIAAPEGDLKEMW